MPKRAKTTPASTARSFAAYARPDGVADLGGASITAVVERLRPDLQLLAGFDRGAIAEPGPAAADAAQLILDALRRHRHA